MFGSIQILTFDEFNMIQILTAREGYMENCHRDKTNVDRGEAEVDIGFRGVTISNVILSCSQLL